MKHFLVIGIVATLLISGCSDRAEGLVSDIEDFNSAVANATPGSVITMANGVWNDVELKFTGKGEESNLIRLQAQTPGEVIISGQSNLALSGEYLEVSGLVFRNGYTPTSEVISFKTSNKAVANNSRVTNCVIDDFSNPERFDSDYWVGLYGKNNQFDHNSLIGKRNLGVTMAVRLKGEHNQENGHVIEYNYFGTRQTLGSNGGETLRIGTSHYSRTYSNTKVRFNYFDRASGELEIISSKSCGNEIHNNVFYECQGTLTMRHGHHTLVENNYFLGNRKPNTGGIRIINEYQTVRKNYLFGLTGHRFRSALTIMNGIYNSPINRYNQVVDSKMDNNLVINSDFIQFCAGSDEERTATPIGSSFSNNLILGTTNLEPFTIFDDVSGITFNGNLLNEGIKKPLDDGFEHVSASLSNNDSGLTVPQKDLLDRIDFGSVSLPVTLDQVGANYYPKVPRRSVFSGKNTVKVSSGTNTLLEALATSSPGDVLELEGGKTYLLTKYAIVKHPITIKASGSDNAIIQSEKQSFFKLENGGSLRFQKITFDGNESPDQAGNNVISTSKYSMNKNYALIVEDCMVKDLDKNHSFDFLKSYQHTFADSIHIINTQMTNITGSILKLDAEVEDLGIYNVENLRIVNSSFDDVEGIIASVYRGGTDESTFGPIVNIENVTINESGKGKRNKLDAALRFHGVQKLNVSNVEITDSKGVDLFLTNGEPISELKDIDFVNSPGLKANSTEYKTSNITMSKK
ncbi:MAG: polysaccharide lyase 6 family protein [Cyclobacteriaceae bacterium]